MLKSTQPMKLIKKIVFILPIFIFLSFFTLTPTPANGATCTSNNECANDPSLTGCTYVSGAGHFCEFAVTPTPSPTSGTCTSNDDCVKDHNLTGCTTTSYGQYETYDCEFAIAVVPKKPQGNCQEDEINTALGCISTDVESGGFINSLLQLAIGLGGAIALLLILGGVFIITTSAGIPDKLNQGKELITSAISGLLFIILSIFLLHLIGIQILSIPGF